MSGHLEHGSSSSDQTPYTMFSDDIGDIVICETILSKVHLIIHSGLPTVGYNDHRQCKEQWDTLSTLVDVANGFKIPFILISDIISLGTYPHRTLLDESAQWNQREKDHPLGYFYHRGEREIWRGIAEGLEAWIVSPTCMSMSPQAKTYLLKIASNSHSASPVTGTLGIVSHIDVVKIIELIIERAPDEHRSFICNGHNISYHEWFTRLNNASSHLPAKRSLLDQIKSSLLNKQSDFPDLEVQKSYDNQLSKDVLQMSYRDLSDTLGDFSEDTLAKDQ